MESTFDSVSSFVESRVLVVPGGLATVMGLLLCLVVLYQASCRDRAGPPSIPEAIPYVTNTYLFIKDMTKLIERAKETFGSGSIVKYRLASKPAYLVRGQRNIQTLNRPSPDMGSEGFMLMVMKNFWNFQPRDALKFEKDKTGRLKAPAPGTESHPESQRYWLLTHNLYHQYLSTAHYANALAAKYYSLFNERLERQPLGNWATVQLWKYMRVNMLESATVSLDGPRMLELNPNYVDAYWEFDLFAFTLVYGQPKVLNRRAYRAQENFFSMTDRYLKSAWKEFDWDGPAADSDWDENFGSRFSRELAKFSRDTDFDERSAAGFFGAMLFGLNSNTIPITTWMLFHIAKDPSLFQAVRDEARQAITVDPTTGARSINLARLLALPLIQSTYLEALRVYVSVTVARETVNPIVLQGHKVPKGAFVQGMTGISHLEEEVWAKDGHPASEFWPARHIVYKERESETGEPKLLPEVSMEGRANAFFPYGGGSGICLGRHFAKQEILISVASIVSRFDLEFEEWTHMDGSKSAREAHGSKTHVGTGAMPPDRDMKVRWKRVW